MYPSHHNTVKEQENSLPLSMADEQVVLNAFVQMLSFNAIGRFLRGMPFSFSATKSVKIGQ